MATSSPGTVPLATDFATWYASKKPTPSSYKAQSPPTKPHERPSSSKQPPTMLQLSTLPQNSQQDAQGVDDSLVGQATQRQQRAPHVRTFHPLNPIVVFTLFPHLPTELRIKIWRHALPRPRIVESEQHIEWTVFGNLFGALPRSLFSTPPIALLQVCRESRKETLRFYSPMLSTDFHGFQVYFDLEMDTCFLMPSLPQAHSFEDLELQMVDSLRSVTDGCNDVFRRSLRKLALATPCGFPLSRDDSILHLKPLLKFRNLESIIWITALCEMPSLDSWGPRIFDPKGPYAPRYWFADPDEILPFRNSNRKEPGFWVDSVFQIVKQSITERLPELDPEWKVPKMLSRIIIRKAKDEPKLSHKFLFLGKVHEW